MDNAEAPTGTTRNPLVFWGSSAVIALLLIIGAGAPERAEQFFGAIQNWIASSLGWFYILAVAGFLISVLVLAFSRYGQIRLGPDDSTPDYSYFSWIAMLFAAGMGIGLMFFAVAEPIQHFSSPPEADPHSIQAAREAMVITFFHWGIHAWAVYAVVGLSLAYFSFRYHLPLTIRSGLYPLIGNRIYGRLGDAVDIFAVVSTVFGIATSLGFGVLQIDAGLGYLLNAPQTVWFQLLLIAVVISMATLSVVSGLDKGVKRLSEANLIIALLLMTFILVIGPTGFILKAFTQNIGNYLHNFAARTFNLYAYEPRGWMANWTLFYWAWWIAWSPFVGMFIARISRGRTIREFATGVLLVPSAMTFLWMTVFGNTAISLDMGAAMGGVSAAVAEDISTALFRFLEYLPFDVVTSTLAVMLVAVFFVTSADSGSLVVDTISSGGVTDTPVWQRIYWCSLEGITAGVLLLAGGLTGLQTMTLIAALPFAIVMIFLVIGLFRGMQADLARQDVQRHVAARPSADVPWRKRLRFLIQDQTEAEVRTFLATTVQPALAEVAEEMHRSGQEASVTVGEDGTVTLVAAMPEARDFLYGIRPVREYTVALTAAEVIGPEKRRPQAWEAQTFFADGSRGYNTMGFTQQQIIGDALDKYEQHLSLIQSDKAALYITSPGPAAPEGGA
ncbi:MAG TPA: BCCT family transporter [Pedomonas sp.]|uniref:BCCT family transporter n=1 Tax=Pedomonas sp. TaxID=2976421 RepID=UPI002F42C56F